MRWLDEALRGRSCETWVDWRDITPAEEFLKAIYPAIEATDAFVFVLSPDSVASVPCALELKHAAKHNKRLIPIVAREVRVETAPEPLAKLNWIFCRETDDFAKATDDLSTALNTDPVWIRDHTRLLTRALEWETHQKNDSFVLHGLDLRNAEQWLTEAGAEKDRQPTALQTDYIIASRKAAARRQRITLVAVTCAAVIAVVLAVVAFTQRTKALAQETIAEKRRGEAEEATRKEREARLRGVARQLAAQSELVRASSPESVDLSMLLAAESLRHVPTLEGEESIRRGLALLPRPPVHTADYSTATQLTFSRDGSLLAAVDDGGVIHFRDVLTGGEKGRTAAGQKVRSLVFSPTAKYLFTADGEGAGRVWDVASGTEIDRISFDGEPTALAFSLETPRMAIGTGGANGEGRSQVRVRDMTARRDLMRLNLDGAIKGIGLTPDGQTMATISSTVWKSVLSIRDVSTSRERDRRDLDGTISDVAFTSSGTTAVFADRIFHIGGGVSGGEAAWVYELEQTVKGPMWNGTPIKLAHNARVESLTVTADESFVAVLCADKSLTLWPLGNGTPVGALTHNTEIRAIAASPKGTYLAIADATNWVRVYNPKNGQTTISRRFGKAVSEMVFHPNERFLTILDEGKQVLVLETTTSAEVLHLSSPDDLRGIAFSPNSQWLATTRADGAVMLWQLVHPLEVRPLAHSGSVLGCVFDPASKNLITVSTQIFGGEVTRGDNDIRVWDITTGREVLRRQREPHSLFALSEDGSRIATTTAKNVVEVSEILTGRVLQRLVHDNAVTNLALSPSGSHIATCVNSRAVRVWNVETGKSGATIASDSEIYVDGLNRNGTLVVTAGYNASSILRIWSAQSGKEVNLNLSGRQFLQTVRFDHQGCDLATLGSDGMVRIWEEGSHKETMQLPAVADAYRLAFTPDDKYLALGNQDGAVRIWERASGRETGRITHEAPVWNLAFSPDGKYLAAHTSERQVNSLWLWLWRAEDLLEEARRRLRRNLSRQEWKEYLPDEPYRKTFSDLEKPQEEP